MKKLLILFITSLFLLCSCNNDKIVLEITSPHENDSFSMNKSIEVNVKATTKKGHIVQVQLTVDEVQFMKSLTDAPYNFTIPPLTFKKEGAYTIAIMAYSSEGMVEGDGVHIKITQ
jgi:hypothetical protein